MSMLSVTPHTSQSTSAIDANARSSWSPSGP